MQEHRIFVLDGGYVRYLDHMGTDLTHSNAARASFHKESAEWSKRDQSITAFLARNLETEPFRHAVLSFELRAPLMVARQWQRYSVASTHLDEQNAWSEGSRRYVTEEPEFYVPVCDEWRSQPDNKKQGSGENIDLVSGQMMTSKLRQHNARGVELYNEAMSTYNVCAEQARLFLPAYGMYVTWRWTASFNAVCWFLAQRLGHSAQREIYEYAVAVYAITRQVFPFTTTRLLRSLILHTT